MNENLPSHYIWLDCRLHMIWSKVLKHEKYRLRNECNRINSFELWLHNGNRLLRMNPCSEVMNSTANALP